MLIKACLKDHGLKFTELHYHVPGSHEHLKHLTTGGTPRPPTKESITRIAKAIFAMTHPVEGASDATHYNPVALWQDSCVASIAWAKVNCRRMRTNADSAISC